MLYDEIYYFFSKLPCFLFRFYVLTIIFPYSNGILPLFLTILHVFLILLSQNYNFPLFQINILTFISM